MFNICHWLLVCGLLIVKVTTRHASSQAQIFFKKIILIGYLLILYVNIFLYLQNWYLGTQVFRNESNWIQSLDTDLIINWVLIVESIPIFSGLVLRIIGNRRSIDILMFLTCTFLQMPQLVITPCSWYDYKSNAILPLQKSMFYFFFSFRLMQSLVIANLLHSKTLTFMD